MDWKLFHMKWVSSFKLNCSLFFFCSIVHFPPKVARNKQIKVGPIPTAARKQLVLIINTDFMKNEQFTTRKDWCWIVWDMHGLQK